MGQEDPLEEEMTTHSSIPAWKIPWTEEPGGLQSMGLQRNRHYLATEQQQKQQPARPTCFPDCSNKLPWTWCLKTTEISSLIPWRLEVYNQNVSRSGVLQGSREQSFLALVAPGSPWFVAASLSSLTPSPPGLFFSVCPYKDTCH